MTGFQTILNSSLQFITYKKNEPEFISSSFFIFRFLNYSLVYSASITSSSLLSVEDDVLSLFAD